MSNSHHHTNHLHHNNNNNNNNVNMLTIQLTVNNYSNGAVSEVVVDV